MCSPSISTVRVPSSLLAGSITRPESRMIIAVPPTRLHTAKARRSAKGAKKIFLFLQCRALRGFFAPSRSAVAFSCSHLRAQAERQGSHADGDARVDLVH